MDFIYCNVAGKMVPLSVDEYVGLTQFLYMMKPNIRTHYGALFDAYTRAGMEGNLLKLFSESPEVRKVLYVNK